MRAKLKKGVEMVSSSAAMGALSSLSPFLSPFLSLCLFLFSLFHGAVADRLRTISVLDEREGASEEQKTPVLAFSSFFFSFFSDAASIECLFFLSL